MAIAELNNNGAPENSENNNRHRHLKRQQAWRMEAVA